MGKYQKKSGVTPVTILLFLVFFSMVAFAVWKLWSIYSEYAFSAKSYENLAEQFSSQVTNDEKNIVLNPTIENNSVTLGEYAPIRVDFEKLLEEGPEIVAWLYSEDTPINYPIVQHKNNDYYLDRLPNSEFSPGGTIFVESKNEPGFSDWNNILYGHNMNDGSMFASLIKYRWQGYAEEHSVMYLLTPEQDYKIEIIGGYTTLSTSDSYDIPYDIQGRDKLVKKAEDYSEFPPLYQAGAEERLITLSTCTYEYDEARFVLIGIMKEISKPPLPSGENQIENSVN